MLPGTPTGLLEHPPLSPPVPVPSRARARAVISSSSKVQPRSSSARARGLGASSPSPAPRSCGAPVPSHARVALGRCERGVCGEGGADAAAKHAAGRGDVVGVRVRGTSAKAARSPDCRPEGGDSLRTQARTHSSLPLGASAEAEAAGRWPAFAFAPAVLGAGLAPRPRRLRLAAPGGPARRGPACSAAASSPSLPSSTRAPRRRRLSSNGSNANASTAAAATRPPTPAVGRGRGDAFRSAARLAALAAIDACSMRARDVCGPPGARQSGQALSSAPVEQRFRQGAAHGLRRKSGKAVRRVSVARE